MMILPANLPWADTLWNDISSSIGDAKQPVCSWGISNVQFDELERFLNVVVVNGLNVHWDPNHISTTYAKLFIAWIAEHYRRNGSVTQNIAADYKDLCGFSQPKEWTKWVERGESALGRSAIFVGGGVRSYVARIQQEAGILRKIFEGYESGGFRKDGTVCIYWKSILELWDRLDFSEHQLLRWQTGKDWYSREPGTRPGGEGFYSQFYEYSLIFLRDISQALAKNPSLQCDFAKLSNELSNWVDPSPGLENFLRDICGGIRSVGSQRSGISWEPKAERCLYPHAGNICTRLRSPSQLPAMMLSGLKDLGGDRLYLKAFGEVSEYDLGQYFVSSGSAYQFESEAYIAPLDSVRVTLQGNSSSIETMLLDSLPEEYPWFFVQEQNGDDECWKLVDDTNGRFPLIVSVLKNEVAGNFHGIASFDLTQPGLQDRICLRFETLEALQASGLVAVRGAGRSLQLVPTPPKQPIQVFWNGRIVPVSMGLPRVATGARGCIEWSDSPNGVYQPIGQHLNKCECGYFRVRSGNDAGPAMRLAVLPFDFGYTWREPTPGSVELTFTGTSCHFAPRPVVGLDQGLWRDVKYGSFLEYSLGESLVFKIPAPVSGIAWKHLYGAEIQDARVSLKNDQEISLCLDVPRNPAIVNLEVRLWEANQEVSKICLEYDFFSPIGSGDRTLGRINLGSMGDGVVRKMFAMTNHLDARVEITGKLSGAGKADEKLPKLTVFRFVKALEDEEHERFWVFPLDPSKVHDIEPSELSQGVWFHVPCVKSSNRMTWNRTHRTSAIKKGKIQPNYLDDSLHHILLGENPRECMEKIHARLGEDICDSEWNLIEDSFKLIREYDVPLVSLWLPQATLRHDKMLCKLLDRQQGTHLHKWIVQSSHGRFGTFGFDLRLVRTNVLDSVGRKCREELWSEIHLLHTGARISDVLAYEDPVMIMSRKWIANPETSHDLETLKLRWNRLYECGNSRILDLDDNACNQWKLTNHSQQEAWDKQRCVRLSNLEFKDGVTPFEFNADAFDRWKGYASAWDKNPKLQIPKWIKATKWLGWFTVHATDEQYRDYLPFALKTMKMLEATDPEWFKSAFQIAQAQALH